MTTKEFIQLFVPPIYYKVKKHLFPKEMPQVHPLPKIMHTNQRMVVIGNGPSLIKTVELYEEKLHEADCIMVNYSACTPLFEQIRPSYYLLVDPDFINSKKATATDIHLLETILLKTSWKMTIVMPDTFKKWEEIKRFKQNQNISLSFYNSYSGSCSVSFYEAWDKNLVAPPGQTVLNTAVWLSLYYGYKETYIVGADSSWLEDTHVEQESNRVYTIDTHFYNNEDVYKDTNLWNKDRRYLSVKYHEEIETIYIILKSYWDLKGYADWKGVKVYNASEYSCIDAFERKKLK